MHKYRFKEPILYRSLAKIAVDLLGKDFILDTYLAKASMQDMQNAQYCWYKEASQKLTREELLEFVLMEDLPNFLEKAAAEVAPILTNIQDILKHSSLKELALNARANLGDGLAAAPEILKKQRSASSKVLDKVANLSKGYANAGTITTGASLGSGSAGKGLSSSSSMRAGTGVSMPSLGGMRSGMMRPLGGAMRKGY
jgi:hypothetical protein